jgi:putative transposase
LFAGLDLGEIHIAAVCTRAGDALLVSGRALRSVKRQRRLLKNKTRASANLTCQPRHILPKASRHGVNFCSKHPIHPIAIGDVRDIHNGVNLGSLSNQKISQWPHGQFKQSSEYKSRMVGMTVDEIAEDCSSRTCSHCSHINNHAPKGRTFSCPRCGAVIHRDVNGSANICSRFAFGSYGFVQSHPSMCLRSLRQSRAFGRSQGINPLLLAQAGTPPI